MMLRIAAWLCAAGLALPAQDRGAAAADAQFPVLDESAFEQHWRHVVPGAEELEWLRIPWRAVLAEAVAAAHAADLPILLWAMNGHPLACT